MSNQDQPTPETQEKPPAKTRESEANFHRSEIFQLAKQENWLGIKTTPSPRGFFGTLFGGPYVPQNDFSFSQKQKILGYLYFKNAFEMDKKKHFTYLTYDKSETKEEIRTRIQHLKEMREYNKMMLISGLGTCQNSIRALGYIAGGIVAAVFMNFFKKTSMVRKGAVAALFIHFGGQIASYRTIDRVFDSLYPIFVEDLEQHLKNEAKEEKTFLEQPLNPAVSSRLEVSSNKKESSGLFKKDF